MERAAVPSLPLLSLCCCLSSFFTHHLVLIYIILLFILHLSWAIHLHVHFFCFSSSFSLCEHPFYSLSFFFFASSHLFESKVSSLRQVRTQKAFYLFILSLFHVLPSFSPASTHLYSHTHPHIHTECQGMF